MSAPIGRVIFWHLLLCTLLPFSTGMKFDDKKLEYYKQRVKDMFYHAYDSYLRYAYPYDELRPLTCDGHDTWGSYSLTLIDALDTLAIMGNYTEFGRVVKVLLSSVDFDKDLNVSVFETNIRVVGGLLSAHLFSHKAGLTLEPGWPCSGPLLRMAEKIARKILPAFDTPTGMPYGTVNLMTGVPQGETTVTCTAGVGTFLIEFGSLTRLTGDPIFEKTAIRALEALWRYKSEIGLVGNHIDVKTGKWTALDGGIGGGIDSYFEYLVKGSIMFQIPGLLDMFDSYSRSLEFYTKRDDWYMWAHMKKGSITLPMFTSLDAYWPGIQSLLGRIDEAMKTIHNFHQVWKQFGFTPEYYNIPKSEVHQGREGYPLRPELVESAMYLYRATKDPYLLEIGVDIFESIEHTARTRCGYATVKNVNDHKLENRMESFFLAETTKYLYLLFDRENFIHNSGNRGTVIQTSSGECVIDAGGYIFNTEAHPIDMASVHCCSAQKTEDDKIIQDLHDDLDLLAILGILDGSEGSKVRGNKWRKSSKMKQNKQLNDVEDGAVTGDYSQQNNMKQDIEVVILNEKGQPVGSKKVDVSQILDGKNTVTDHDKVRMSPSATSFADGKETQRGKASTATTEQTEEPSVESQLKSVMEDTSDDTTLDTSDEDLLSVKREISSGLEKLGANETELVQSLNTELLKTINFLLDSLKEKYDSKSNKNAMNANLGSQSTGNKLLKSTKSEELNRDALKKRVQANLDKIVANFKKIEKSSFDDLEKILSDVSKSVSISDIGGSKNMKIKTDKNPAVLDSGKIEKLDGDNRLDKNTEPENNEERRSENEQKSKSLNENEFTKKTVFSDNSESMTGDHTEGTETSELENKNEKKLHSPDSSSSSHSEKDLNVKDEKIGPKQLTGKIFTLDNFNMNQFSLENTLLGLFSDSKFNIFGKQTDSDPSILNLYLTLENYSINYTVKPEVFQCPAQPFHMRLSVNGEMFVDPKDYY